MAFHLSERSIERLRGVHPDLALVVKCAIKVSSVDFAVLEGLRTRARQEQLVKAGASQTMNSRHLTGHAVDLGAIVEGEVRWDWPLYYKLAEAMFKAAGEIGMSIEWGGNWETFKDGPHFQLPIKKYPA